MYAASDQLIVQNPPVSPALVFTGDSITQFWDSPSPYGEGSLQAVQPFINRGISGQTTEQMLVRFQEDVIKLKPALVHIFGGINDLGGNTGPETLPEIMDQIASMTRLAQSYGIKVLIASVTPTVDTPGNPWSLRRPNSSIVALDQLIQAYCQQSGAVYVDYFDVLVDPKTGAMNVNLTVDGLHPNTQGFALMVPVAQAAIQQALGN
jgi:lysophospholipase L1-like esterase